MIDEWTNAVLDDFDVGSDTDLEGERRRMSKMLNPRSGSDPYK
jgi:hypothetical protein